MRFVCSWFMKREATDVYMCINLMTFLFVFDLVCSVLTTVTCQLTQRSRLWWTTWLKPLLLPLPTSWFPPASFLRCFSSSGTWAPSWSPTAAAVGGTPSPGPLSSSGSWWQASSSTWSCAKSSRLETALRFCRSSFTLCVWLHFFLELWRSSASSSAVSHFLMTCRCETLQLFTQECLFSPQLTLIISAALQWFQNISLKDGAALKVEASEVK